MSDFKDPDFSSLKVSANSRNYSANLYDANDKLIAEGRVSVTDPESSVLFYPTKGDAMKSLVEDGCVIRQRDGTVIRVRAGEVCVVSEQVHIHFHRAEDDLSRPAAI